MSRTSDEAKSSFRLSLLIVVGARHKGARSRQLSICTAATRVTGGVYLLVVTNVADTRVFGDKVDAVYSSPEARLIDTVVQGSKPGLLVLTLDSYERIAGATPPS